MLLVPRASNVKAMNEQIRPNLSPAELAEPIAMNLMIKGVYDDDEYAEYEFEQMERLASQAHELELVEKKYIVKSGRSILMPARFSSDETLTAVQFNELDFEAEFLTYSSLRGNQKLGGSAIRGLCLTFEGVTLLPDRDVLPSDRHLHVPVYSVQDMDMIKT